MESCNSWIGTTRYNNSGLEYKVLHKVKRQKNGTWTYEVQFIKTKRCYIVYPNSIRKNTVRDNYSPIVCGVGYIGEARHINNTRFYRIWHNMLVRCYSPKSKDYKTYGAKGVHVCERWHNLNNFIQDIRKIEGYDAKAFLQGTIQLDKDIKQSKTKEKVYSVETCKFLTLRENIAERNHRYSKLGV